MPSLPPRHTRHDDAPARSMIATTMRGRAAVASLQALMLALVIVYVVVLTPPFGGRQAHFSAWRDFWLVTAALVLAMVITGARAVVVTRERAAWGCLTAAVAWWTAGNLQLLLAAQSRSPLPRVRWADAGYFACYVVAWLGIVLLLRAHRENLGPRLWLAGLVDGLAGAAVAAVVLPALVTAASGHFSMGATTFRYPVTDLVLLATVLGAYGILGRRPPRVWLLLGFGVLALAFSHTHLLLEASTGTYRTGSTWDAGWLLGLATFPMAAWLPTPAVTPASQTRWTALVVPSLCSGLGLGLLTYGSLSRLPTVTVILAAGCVLAGLARTALTYSDVQALHAARREARTDDLTGLANRREFYARLAELVKRPPEDGGLAVLVIDLDRFKQVNDSLGYHVGDKVLQMVARRLGDAVRSADVLARVGGDEFGVIVTGVDRVAASAAVKRLRDALQDPFPLDQITLHVDASFGVALVPEHGNEVDLVVQRADLAMHHAKASGSGMETYCPERDGNIDDRLVTTEELRTALYSDQLVLHYQPKLTLATGKVTGVEALVRWQHPRRGLVPPDDFLPLAEAAGLMPALTTVVIDRAVRQCAAWRAEGVELSVAVNLSASDLLDRELPSLVLSLLANFGLNASALHLEITETVLLRDGAACIPVLESLSRSGLRLAIDDYGTGYSSLAYLATLPVQDLKLDQSFIKAMDGGGPAAQRARSIVISTIAMAQGLGLGFIAEGVETATSLAELTELGCETVQGYYLSRPLPAVELVSWLAARGDVAPRTTPAAVRRA